MGDLVNLNKYRKSKKRNAADRQAAMNRDKFGRSKAEIRHAEALREEMRKTLEGKKLEDRNDDR